MFGLSFSQEQELVLVRLGQLAQKSVLLSSRPLPEDMVRGMFDDAKERLAQRAHVLGRLCGGKWPASEDTLVEALCSEPMDFMAWRRRCYVLLAITGSMLFIVDDKVSSSQDLVSFLTVARIIGARTAGVIPEGATPAALPSSVLSAADLVVSGEAEPSLLGVVLRSLSGEG